MHAAPEALQQHVVDARLRGPLDAGSHRVDNRVRVGGGGVDHMNILGQSLLCVWLERAWDGLAAAIDHPTHSVPPRTTRTMKITVGLTLRHSSNGLRQVSQSRNRQNDCEPNRASRAPNVRTGRPARHQRAAARRRAALRRRAGERHRQWRLLHPEHRPAGSHRGTVSGADHTMHGLVIAEEDGFYAAAGTNITCDRTTFERLTNDWNNRYRGLVKGSWGFMQCVAQYGWSQMHRCTGGNAARTATRTFNFYAVPGVRYRVCGFSFYNEYFGQSATVRLRNSESRETLIEWQSASYWTRGLDPNRGAFQPGGQNNMGSMMNMGGTMMGNMGFNMGFMQSPPPPPPGGSSDIFHLGDVYLAASVDCSGAPSSTCASLNREECTMVANTCGECLECFEPVYSNVTGPSNLPCVALAPEAPIAAPTLTSSEGTANAIGGPGANATTLRIAWEKPDCNPVVKYRIYLRILGEGSLVVWEGHPGGGFSTNDALRIAHAEVSVSVRLISKARSTLA